MQLANDVAILSFSQEHAEGLRQLISELDQWFDRSLADDLLDAAGPDSTLVAINAAGRVVGFVEVALLNNTEGRITWAGVAPDWQRRGVGTALMQTVIQEAAAAGLMRLWVETMSDTVAYTPFARTRRFYEKLGFIPTIELGDHADVGLETTDWLLELTDLPPTGDAVNMTLTQPMPAG